MSTSPPASGASSVVEALLSTLRDETAALRQLSEAAGQQLEALQAQDELEAHQHATQQAVGKLEQLRTSRERHLRLLGRLLRLEAPPAGVAPVVEALRELPEGQPQARALLDTRQDLREQAQAAQATCEALDFALRYALSLGQEMMQAISALNVPPPPKVYTARGDASAGTPRSLVDRVG